ncbi:hypothetical protein Agub_g15351 [Astrephomene gubernaculifera]|uniref:Uncharacterized protein n=1 Tax=Astrephomene gubernaculifera TaxID=47775 RepID=A0AAD3E2V7_9CHLO|nr:hypothetical protein Agub_g15351 [Astrephomene gubernaculifera]
MSSHCPAGADNVSTAVKKCPFLHNIAQTHGENYASSLAGKPACPVGHGAGSPGALVQGHSDAFQSTLALFHGKHGVLPLPHLSKPSPEVLYPVELPVAAAQQEPAIPKCPMASGTAVTAASHFREPFFAAAPLASMSMSWGSNWFNIHHLFQQHLQQHRAQQKKPPQQPKQQPNGAHGGVSGPGLSGPGASSGHGLCGPSGNAGQCPLRRALGPFAGVVFNKNGHLMCPEPIIKMRAALAATKPVRDLRPQALPIKLLAVAFTTAALNVPCGMWREHTKKFSSQWFVAVHATIPFIAMLRKAVIMPKYAILFTICAAIAGQTMGAKYERRRVLAQTKDELAGLARAKPVAVALPRPTSGPASSSSSGRQAAPLPVASMLLSAQPTVVERGNAAASAAAGTAAAPSSGTAASWVVQEGGQELTWSSSSGATGTRSSPLRAALPRPQHLHFRVRGRSVKRSVKAEEGVALLGQGACGRGAAGPVIAMLPQVTC